MLAVWLGLTAIVLGATDASFIPSEGLVRVYKPTKYLGDLHQPLEQHGSWFLERRPAGLRGDKVPLRGASYGRMHRSRGLGIHQVGEFVNSVPLKKQTKNSEEEFNRGANHYGAVFYHGGSLSPGPKKYEEETSITGKPVFYGYGARGREEKRSEEEPILSKRGEKAVDKNGMRLSISNNMDVLRDKLFTAINGKPGSPNDQGKMANLKDIVASSHQAMLLHAARNRAKQRFFVSPKDNLRKYRRNSQQIFKNRMLRMSPLSLPIHHIG